MMNANRTPIIILANIQQGPIARALAHGHKKANIADELSRHSVNFILRLNSETRDIVTLQVD